MHMPSGYVCESVFVGTCPATAGAENIFLRNDVAELGACMCVHACVFVLSCMCV